MKKIQYKPYNFEFKFEYRTYKNIGTNYEVETMSKCNIAYKIRKFTRKIWNMKEKRYRNFDTYSEWEKYISEKVPERCSNYKNFYHYLEQRRKVYDFSVEYGKTVALPIYVAIFSATMTLYALIEAPVVALIFSMLPLVVFILILMTIILKRQTDRRNFYRDYMSILEKYI